MERLELAISGVEQLLRPAPLQAAAPSQPASLGPPPGDAMATAALPTWLDMVRHQLPRLMEALGAEDTSTSDHGLTARSRRLARERNRLLRRVHQLAPSLSDGCLAASGQDQDEIRQVLLRLLHDISHHHQRVNDLLYDAGWRDVGGSE